MKKTYLRHFILLVICALLMTAFPLTAEAETLVEDLFTLDSTRNMGISVKYETEPPAVEFIAPNGAVYGSQAVASGKMSQTDSGTALFFRIPNAEAGKWQIRYDKKSNSNIEVSYGAYAISLTIEQFSFTKKGKDSLDVEFLVKHDKQIEYDYSIYAVVENNGAVTGQKLLNNGYAKANEQQQINVSIDDLATYSNYKLMLEVTSDDNGTTIFDSIVSDNTFSYTDIYAADAPEGFYVEVNTTSGSLLVNWEDTAASRKDTFVALYINDGTEPTYYNTFNSEISATEIAVDLSTTKKVRIELSYTTYSDKKSKIASREIDMSIASAVSLICNDVTASAQAEVVYQLENLPGAPFSAVLMTNGVKQEISLKGNNSFSVKLEQFNNKVELLWFYNEHTAFRIGKEIYSDRIAPSLNIPDALDKMISKESSYILSGSVDAGCTVTVNSTEISVDGNGIFTTTLSLQPGENVFTVIATGPNGNRTQRTFVVQWGEDGLFETVGTVAVIIQYIPLAICVLLSVVLSIFVIMTVKKYIKIKSAKGKRNALLSVAFRTGVLVSVLSFLATSAFAALWIYVESKLNSVEFYDIVVSSGVEEAYEIIITRDNYMLDTIIAAVCCVVSVLVAVIVKKMSKKTPKKEISDVQ